MKQFFWSLTLNSAWQENWTLGVFKQNLMRKVVRNLSAKLLRTSCQDWKFVIVNHWLIIHNRMAAQRYQSKPQNVFSAQALLRQENLTIINFTIKAMMHLRNTPDPDCNVSPAKIVFEWPICDAFPPLRVGDRY